LNIEPEILVPKRIEAFESEFGDKELANLHFRHYQMARQKNLLRISERINKKLKDLNTNYKEESFTKRR
jgi:hypothetical protein